MWPTFAVKLGPPEYFMLMVLAFTTVSAVLGKSTVRGITALFVGLAAGCIGMGKISGAARYTGGKPELLDGIDIVLVAVGLFISEALSKETSFPILRKDDIYIQWPILLKITARGTKYLIMLCIKY